MVAMATAPMGNVYAHHAKENLHINQPPESWEIMGLCLEKVAVDYIKILTMM